MNIDADGPCPQCFHGDHCRDCGASGCDYCEAEWGQ